MRKYKFLMLSGIVLSFSSMTCYANTSNIFHYDIEPNFQPNVYISGQLGYGVPDYGSNIKNAFNQYPTHSYDEDGLAGRVSLGYQFTSIFGLEAGYTLFSDNTYSAAANNMASKVRLETSALDLLAVLRTPFLPFGQSGPTLSIKGGAAYVMSRANLSGQIMGQAIDISHSRNNWEPEAGISLGYKLENNLLVDIGYQHTFGRGDYRSSPKIDFVSLGLTYKFV